MLRFTALLLLPTIEGYWPTAHGDFDGASSAGTRGPSSLGLAAGSAALGAAQAVPVLVGPSGTTFTATGTDSQTLYALDGRTLAQLWAKALTQQGTPPSPQPLVQLQPDGTLYASGLGLLDAAGKVLHQPNSCAISVADRQRDFAFGSCGGNTWGLFHVSDGSPVWPTIFLSDSNSFSWLCTLGNGNWVMSLCTTQESDCRPLLVDPTAPSFARTFLPVGFSHGTNILQAFQNSRYFVLLSGDVSGYFLDVGEVATSGPPISLSFSLTFDGIAPPYAAAQGGYLYVTGFSSNAPQLAKYDLSSANALPMWVFSLQDYGGSVYTSLAVDSAGTVYASGSNAGGLYVFSTDGVPLLQAAPGSYSSIALGPEGSLYAFSGTAVKAFLSPAASSAPPAWHLYAEVGAGALGALLLAGLLIRWFGGPRWCCCCFRGSGSSGGGSDDDYDGYEDSSSGSSSAQGGDYEFYAEPALLIKDSAPSSPFSLGSLFSGGGSAQETTFKASAGRSVFGDTETTFKASAGRSLFGGGDAFGTAFRASGNPWSSSGGGSGGGGSSSSASNPF
jgi:hypothetical protein